MGQAIVKKDDAAEEIGQEKTNQEGELESLSFCHSISNWTIWRKLLFWQMILVPSTATLGLLEQGLLLGPFLNNFAFAPDEPDLAQDEDSDESRDKHSDDQHIDLTLRVEAQNLSLA